MRLLPLLPLVLLACGEPRSPDPGEGSPQRTAPTAAQDESEPLAVPSDPRARYFVVERAGTAARPVITTKRVGPSGTSYARREFDCGARRVRYLGEGDTKAEADRPNEEPNLSSIVDGSIADYVRGAACGSP